MTPEGKLKLKNLLVSDESYRQFPYQDSTGHLTIGIGRNLTNSGISITEAFYLLDDDILYFTAKLRHFLDFFDDLAESRQIALINMCFNLGVQGFLEFKDFTQLLREKKYDDAASDLMQSKAAHQLPERYHRLAYIIKTGEYP